jgi:hypothetical protein
VLPHDESVVQTGWRGALAELSTVRASPASPLHNVGIPVLARFIALPIEIRVACVTLIAVACARFINWAIVRWAYFKRPAGPWEVPPVGYPARTWRDHWPIVGWLYLRREAPQRGKLFWLRPLLIELAFPLAMACYYQFYISGGALSLGQAARLLVQTELHYQFLLTLFCLC